MLFDLLVFEIESELLLSLLESELLDELSSDELSPLYFEPYVRFYQFPESFETLLIDIALLVLLDSLEVLLISDLYSL